MSVDESSGSTPLVDPSESPSPAPSSSNTESQFPYTNGFHTNGFVENARLSSPVQIANLPNNIHLHRVQSSSPADDCQFIKRPLNAYMIWTSEERKKILARDPKMKMNEISRMMGEKWKNMTERDKRPFFDRSKQSQLEHRKALKENPNLVYHPQRKKMARLMMKNDMNLSFDISPNTSFSNRQATPVNYASPPPKLNGASIGNCANVASPGLLMSQNGNGNMILSQTTGNKIQQHLTPQRNGCGTDQKNISSQQNVSATMHQMLEMYYTSLCQPAFPEPGEKSTLAAPQYYLDQYQQLHYQALASQYRSNQSSNTYQVV